MAIGIKKTLVRAEQRYSPLAAAISLVDAQAYYEAVDRAASGLLSSALPLLRGCVQGSIRTIEQAFQCTEPQPRQAGKQSGMKASVQCLRPLGQ